MKIISGLIYHFRVSCPFNDRASQ